MRYAQTLSVYIIYSNEAVYYPSYAGIIRIRSEGITSQPPQNKNGTPGYLISYFCSCCSAFPSGVSL